MPGKIFISYRRQDSGASALGIGQYLEHEFGRKNVFIDVDMRAGAKFPKVLEQRLAECKVMLVLIGPDWLNATDEQGRRRLDDPDDWVRLEIAHALNRNITVIPVRVNGAELPSKGNLPSDIRGLLDHQAVSVTLAGFRNEMSGLVRDIRSIPSPWPWRRFGVIAAGLLCISVFVVAVGSPLVERIRSLIPSTVPGSTRQDDIWSGKPGEWVMYEFVAVGEANLAHQFKPASVRIFGDRVAYEARNAMPPANAAQGVYETVINVIDCKKSVSALAERTRYNSQQESISHFKWGEPESLDLSIGGPIMPNSILAVAERMLCSEEMRAPLLPKGNVNMKFLSRTASGDGDISHGPAKTISNSDYKAELVTSIKLDADHPFAELFPGKNIIGLPRSFRTQADRLRLNCAERKAQIVKTERYDSENNLSQIAVLLSVRPVAVAQGTPLALILGNVCGPSVQGTYEGTNHVTYAKGSQGDQKISIVVEQIETELKASFKTAAGGQGQGTGKLGSDGVATILFQGTTESCPGSFEASLKFVGDTASWTYKGEDCDGLMEGHGSAQRKL
jgi:hypothetical protein